MAKCYDDLDKIVFVFWHKSVLFVPFPDCLRIFSPTFHNFTHFSSSSTYYRFSSRISFINISIIRFKASTVVKWEDLLERRRNPSYCSMMIILRRGQATTFLPEVSYFIFILSGRNIITKTILILRVNRRRMHRKSFKFRKKSHRKVSPKLKSALSQYQFLKETLAMLEQTNFQLVQATSSVSSVSMHLYVKST